MADITITPASVTVDTAYSVVTEDGYAGATVTAGQAVYLDSSSLYQLSDANGAAALRTVRGIALHAASTGQPLRIARATTVLNIGATVAAGIIYVSSATPGGIAPAADLTTGWYSTVIGVGISTSKVQLVLYVSGAVVA